MKRLSYKIASFCSKYLGSWFLKLFVWFVATGYFLLYPSRVRSSQHFYSTIYPNRSWKYHIWCAWKQYHSFAKVFVDRFEYSTFKNIKYVSENESHLEEAYLNSRGGILLMSHLGNWEIAAHILKRKYKELPLLLYMGARNKEQIESMQKRSLQDSGIQVIGIEQGQESPYDIIQGVRFVRSGGFVSMTGDVLWHPEQRRVEATLLGHSVLLAEAPHYLALITGVPLFVLFTIRVNKREYMFSVSDPIYLAGDTKLEKKRAVQKSAQIYANLLEQKIKKHPFQWYHFKPFLGQKKY